MKVVMVMVMVVGGGDSVVGLSHSEHHLLMEFQQILTHQPLDVVWRHKPTATIIQKFPIQKPILSDNLFFLN